MLVYLLVLILIKRKVMKMSKKAFYDKYIGVAKETSNLLGGKLDPYILLSFWHWETGGGTNRGAKELNNLGGIKWVDQKRKYGINAVQSGMYANYNSLSDYAKDFARVLSLGYYDDVLKAGVTPGYEDDVLAMNKSPYAEADYNVDTIIKNVNEFKAMAGDPIVVDDEQYITIPNPQGMSADAIMKALAVGVAFLGMMALIKD